MLKMHNHFISLTTHTKYLIPSSNVNYVLVWVEAQCGGTLRLGANVLFNQGCVVIELEYKTSDHVQQKHVP